jgi:antitoxin VapB
MDAERVIFGGLHRYLMRYTIAIYTGRLKVMAISTVFTNNRTQAVRLPAEMRLPENVRKVNVRAKGRERIIAPIENMWDNYFLGDARVSDDFMNERGSQEQSDREPL